MKKLSWFGAALLVAVLCTPALAGHAGKCGYDTQACLNAFAAMHDKGYAGMKYDKTESGQLVVKEVIANSPAAEAGIQAGDILVAMNGVKFTDEAGLKKAKGDWKAGNQVTYTVLRSGAEQQIALTLGKMPQEVYHAMIGEHMVVDHVTTTASAEAKPAK